MIYIDVMLAYNYVMLVYSYTMLFCIYNMFIYNYSMRIYIYEMSIYSYVMWDYTISNLKIIERKTKISLIVQNYKSRNFISITVHFLWQSNSILDRII